MPNAKNCVYYTVGSAQYATTPSCQYLHADTVIRQPQRLTLTLNVNASGGTDDDYVPVFVRLQDKSGLDPTFGAPFDNYSWLDRPGHPFKSGSDPEFDLTLDGIRDFDDITGITLGSTGTPICIDAIKLSIDDDGSLNQGGDGPMPSGLPGSAYRVAYYRNFLADVGHCIWTGTVDFNNYNAPGTSLVKVDFNTLRNSPDWQYQHAYWSDVHSAYGGVPLHFSGYPDKSRLASFAYGMFQNRLHDAGWHLASDRPATLNWTNSRDSMFAIQPGTGGSLGTHDMLTGDVYVDAGATVDVFFALQLATLCDSNGTILMTVAEPTYINATIVDTWASIPVISLFAGVVDSIISDSLRPQLMKFTQPLPALPSPARYSFTPLYNATTDTSAYPGLGVEFTTPYCTCVLGQSCPDPLLKLTI